VASSEQAVNRSDQAVKRKKLSDRGIQALKEAPKGRRELYYDSIVSEMAVRVTDRGHRSFVLVTRYPSQPKSTTPRALGEYPGMTLEEARDKARGWLRLIERGIDPKVEEARQRAAEGQRQAATWEAVAEDYLTERAAGKAKAGEARSLLAGEMGKRWKGRPAGDIADHEVAQAITTIVKRGSPHQARNALGHVRQMFKWAIGTRRYSITANPAAMLDAKELCGPKVRRKRILTDAELRECWRAAGELGRVECALVRLLMLTAQRRLELGEATELELQPADWRERTHANLIVPAPRMKADDPHLVPIVGPAFDILRSLPRGTEGDFLFSVTDGETPINGYSKLKDRLDVAMTKPLEAEAAQQPGKTLAISCTTQRAATGKTITLRAKGHAPFSKADIGRVIGICHDGRWGYCRVIELKAPDVAEVRIMVAFAESTASDLWLMGGDHFVLHDLRRTARTHLSALPVEDIVRELIVAHAQPMLRQTYDLYAYADEKRRALELLGARIMSIVEPQPASVTPIEKARTAQGRR
jgi:integrase